MTEDNEDEYSHIVHKDEIMAAIVEGRDAVAVCGSSGEIKTFRGDFSGLKPLCPFCQDFYDELRKK